MSDTNITPELKEEILALVRNELFEIVDAASKHGPVSNRMVSVTDDLNGDAPLAHYLKKAIKERMDKTIE